MSWTLRMPIGHRSRKSGHDFSYLNIDPWLDILRQWNSLHSIMLGLTKDHNQVKLNKAKPRGKPKNHFQSKHLFWTHVLIYWIIVNNFQDRVPSTNPVLFKPLKVESKMGKSEQIVKLSFYPIRDEQPHILCAVSELPLNLNQKCCPNSNYVSPHPQC